MHPLRLQMQRDMKLRGLAPRTQKTYIDAVAALAKHHRCSPDRLGSEQIQGYVLHLLDRKLSWSSCNQAICAFRFFYGVTLKRPALAFEIPNGRTPQRQPQILSRDEVRRVIAETRRPVERVMLTTAYAAGLRVSELVALRWEDIDSQRMTIKVNQGKGAMDRYTILSPSLLPVLRDFWKLCRPKGPWIFPGRGLEQHIRIDAAQRAYKQAKENAGITKRGGIHALRHAFATHLLEAGVDLNAIKQFLGHGSLGTTQRYLHLTQMHLKGNAAALDLLKPS